LCARKKIHVISLLQCKVIRHAENERERERERERDRERETERERQRPRHREEWFRGTKVWRKLKLRTDTGDRRKLVYFKKIGQKPNTFVTN